MIKKENYNIPGARGRGMLMDITFNTAHQHAPLVIFAHGFKGFKDWGTHNLVAEYFAEHGFRFLKFNFSHNGTTAQNPVDFTDLIAFADNTFSMELEDLHDVIDFVCNGSSMPTVSGVYLIGHSMGGGICIIQAAADKRIKKLVTMASISAFGNLWPKEAEEQWKLQGIMYVENKRTGQKMPLKSTLLADLNHNPGQLDILAKAAQVTQPWLIVHGEKDTSVLPKFAKELKKANNHAELVIIPGADHTFGGMHPYSDSELPKPLQQFCDDAIAFFKKG
jgi:pimeloyl-ACP methyl ester carboxylesterase